MLTTLFILMAVVQVRSPLLEAKGIADDCSNAFRTKDKGWFERHLATGFVYEDLEGERQGRAAMMKRLDRWFHPFAYRVEPSLALVSAKRTGKWLLIVSDLKVISQPLRPWRTSVTETTIRAATYWLPQGREWSVHRILEQRSTKLVDGVPEPE